eukprot:4640426-Prymnesium_polylepis.1
MQLRRRLLVVRVVVVARLRSRPPRTRPGRRRHCVEAGVAVGQRAAKRAAQHCAAEISTPATRRDGVCWTACHVDRGILKTFCK